MLTGAGRYDTIHGQHCVGKTKIKETFMEKLHDLKFFAKPPKGKMKGLLIVFAWIILWKSIKLFTELGTICRLQTGLSSSA